MHFLRTTKIYEKDLRMSHLQIVIENLWSLQYRSIEGMLIFCFRPPLICKPIKSKGEKNYSIYPKKFHSFCFLL